MYLSYLFCSSSLCLMVPLCFVSSSCVLFTNLTMSNVSDRPSYKDGIPITTNSWNENDAVGEQII